MANFNREVIFTGSSTPELSEALTRLSEAHQILVLHQGSFASEGENPLEHTKKAMELLQNFLKQSR
ncbi:hypothetical protein [Nostoc sp. TCL240-02]|uniref:hypothetical protein n=1 Tax=Nostoc sp. TCL240-02 TaxID=2572090 RepID=UPI00157FB64B|nr:hypothetical protein [Nostoc sp. TCL240-02]QKQ75664.1 hypothetical protein FBB35_22315 [Nostoc sp. TCL240-02]